MVIGPPPQPDAFELPEAGDQPREAPAFELSASGLAGIDSRVLVVDDDPALLQLVAMTLRDEGFGVLTAANGEEALAVVNDDDVSAIVLDLEMPVMDGRSFFRELRARGYQTPVLLLSANQPRAARREIGAEAALEKPFEPYLLAHQLRQLISQIS